MGSIENVERGEMMSIAKIYCVNCQYEGQGDCYHVENASTEDSSFSVLYSLNKKPGTLNAKNDCEWFDGKTLFRLLFSLAGTRDIRSFPDYIPRWLMPPPFKKPQTTIKPKEGKE